MNNGYTQRIIGRLREEGLKVTPQRIAVLKFLDGNRDHPSVEEIHREVLKEFPTISLATVYNTLDTLEHIQEVKAIVVDPNRKHYDPDTSVHHHAVCSRCHTILDVFADYRPVLQVPSEVGRDFEVTEATVFFRGFCKDCTGTAS